MLSVNSHATGLSTQLSTPQTHPLRANLGLSFTDTVRADSLRGNTQSSVYAMVHCYTKQHPTCCCGAGLRMYPPKYLLRYVERQV